MMDTTLAGLDDEVAYLDVILIKKAMKIVHVRLFQRVFQKLHDYGFKL